jgi:hypothetical protein
MPYISTVDVVTRIAARISDQDMTNRDGVPVRDPAKLVWLRRNRAIRLILEALRAGELSAWAQLGSNPPVQLSSIDWVAPVFGYEIIVGGAVRAAVGERIARFEDATVLFDTDEGWLERQLIEDVPPAGSEAAYARPAAALRTIEAAAPPGPRPGGGQSPKGRCANEANRILDDETQRPQRGKGRKIAVARLVREHLSLSHAAETISRYISRSVIDWEQLHPGQ